MTVQVSLWYNTIKQCLVIDTLQYKKVVYFNIAYSSHKLMQLLATMKRPLFNRRSMTLRKGSKEKKGYMKDDVRLLHLGTIMLVTLHSVLCYLFVDLMDGGRQLLWKQLRQ